MLRVNAGQSADVQPSRIDRVAGQQEPGVRVVERHRCLVVPRRGKAFQDAAAEIDSRDGIRSCAEPEILARRCPSGVDDDGSGAAGELPVAGDVVAVWVGV